MQKVIEIKRDSDKNQYYFLDNLEVNIGDKVVVNFEDFQTVAVVSRLNVSFDKSKEMELSKIIRKATQSDLKKFEELSNKAKKDLKEIKKLSLKLGLTMKFVGAEYSLDNSKIIISFSSEERVDFRQLLKDLASMLKTRIELRQIGQRDEIQILGGVGPCGEPCCCSRFLKDFDHVTVKMAKIQGLSLSPTKINGICGRLMCCLGYESSTYEEILSKMPKVNSEVISPNGKGIVVYNDILRERVSVKRQAEGDTFVVEDFSLEQISFEGKKVEKHDSKTEKHEQKAEKHDSKTEKHDKKSESHDLKTENGDQKLEKHSQKPERKKVQQKEDKKVQNNGPIPVSENELEVQMLGESKPNGNKHGKFNKNKKFGFKKNK